MYGTTTREHLVGVAPLDTGRATASRTERSERQTNDPLHPSYDHMATTRKLNSGKSFMTTNKLKTYAAATIINEWHTRLASLNDRSIKVYSDRRFWTMLLCSIYYAAM